MILHICLCLTSVDLLNHVWLFVTPWTAARQASLSITMSRSMFKLMSIKMVMPSNHLILCHPLLLLSSIFPGIRVFSSESVLCIRWLKYWSFSISPSNEYSGLISLSAYLRLLIFLPGILIPTCASFSPEFRMMYSACKLNKQGENIQPWCTLSQFGTSPLFHVCF